MPRNFSTYLLFLRNRLPRYEQPVVETIRNLTPCVVVDQRLIGANARSTVGTASDVAPLVRLLFSRVGKPSAGGSMAYSFNHPPWHVSGLHGPGRAGGAGRGENVRHGQVHPPGGGIRFRQFSGGSWQEIYYTNNPYLDPDKKLRDYSGEEWQVLRIGTKEPLIVDHIYKNTGQVSHLPYEGMVTRFDRLYLNQDISGLKKEIQEGAMAFVRRCPCPSCGGLNPKALASRINGYNISDYYAMQVSGLLSVLEAIEDPWAAPSQGRSRTISGTWSRWAWAI